MNFKCKKEDLIIGLNNVSRTVSTRTTMPILEGVLIETYDNNIKLTTNDLEIGSEYIIPAVIEASGSTVVDLKTFNEIIRKIESEDISFEINNGIFIIKSTSGVFKLLTQNPDDFTRLPVFNAEREISISEKMFKDMVKKTVFATSSDPNRPVYTGALVEVVDNEVSVVALDGFRMAVRREILERPSMFKAIIPAKALTEITKTLSDDEEAIIKIGLNKNQALFRMGPCTVISRIIEGDFLNYNKTLPTDIETRVRIGKKTLLEALERVSIFSKEDKKIPVKINMSLDFFQISCAGQAGDAKESVNAVVSGKDLEIGFNPRYLIEALKVIDDDEVELEFSSPLLPVVIRPLAGSGYVYMVLPLKLKD
ncbi:MAG: DNA polymerase III subunit beta [Clostridia bacterium]|nr:DNA polymerase III subunit beta [Clostridia bacterium]